MKIIQKLKIFIFILCCGLFSYFIDATLQEPEIIDQFEKTTSFEDLNNATASTIPDDENEVLPKALQNIQKGRSLIDKSKFARDRTKNNTEIAVTEKPPTFFKRMYTVLMKPVKNLIDIPKVNSVLRNIGICVVNGAMELIAFYLPPPLIPLIASVAGMVIPFEPVVMLREKMPVTSYRRAFRTAVNSFMGTFDKFKLDDDDDDPYMTRRFNRRLANDSGEKKTLLGQSE